MRAATTRGTARNTRQKDAIREALLAADRPLSPEEIMADAQKHVEKLSLATVYRNVAALLEDKWLQMVELPGMPPRYEVAGKEHHHHFHCDVCGRVFELEGCAVNLKLRLPKGFRAQTHEFSVTGQCADCR